MPLRSAKELLGYEVAALEGKAGYVYDIYFDDKRWLVRHLVIDLGELSPGQKVLISPNDLGQLDWETELVPVKLTFDQLTQQPDARTVKPVGCQQEVDLLEDYGWIAGWSEMVSLNGKDGKRDSGHCLEKMTLRLKGKESEEAKLEANDPHLRSLAEVLGYQIQATDGASGHLTDFVLDDRCWTIRYVVVGTHHDWPRKQVSLIPQWIKAVQWREASICVTLSRKTIENCPEYF
ncbi:MAG: PRC-barrel domain-containing protein [Nitrospira sp.]|nr:PRC-barrel domain-containing protein [Nitrospira sp.]